MVSSIESLKSSKLYLQKDAPFILIFLHSETIKCIIQLIQYYFRKCSCAWPTCVTISVLICRPAVLLSLFSLSCPSDSFLPAFPLFSAFFQVIKKISQLSGAYLYLQHSTGLRQEDHRLETRLGSNLVTRLNCSISSVVGEKKVDGHSLFLPSYHSTDILACTLSLPALQWVKW